MASSSTWRVVVAVVVGTVGTGTGTGASLDVTEEDAVLIIAS